MTAMYGKVNTWYASSTDTGRFSLCVLFTENVAGFYQARQSYKTEICDSIVGRVIKAPPYYTEGFAQFRFTYYAILSADILQNMRHLFAQCQQMMNVSNEDLEVYRAERKQMEVSKTGKSESESVIEEKVLRLQGEIERAVKKLNLE